MAIPKKKTSKARRDKRRYSNRWQITAENVVNCANCGAQTRQHCICDTCGHYNGRQVVVVSETNA